MAKKSRKKRTAAKVTKVAPVVAETAAATPKVTMAEAVTGRAPIENSYGHVRGELTRIAAIGATLALILVVLSFVL